MKAVSIVTSTVRLMAVPLAKIEFFLNYLRKITMTEFLQNRAKTLLNLNISQNIKTFTVKLGTRYTNLTSTTIYCNLEKQINEEEL